MTDPESRGSFRGRSPHDRATIRTSAQERVADSRSRTGSDVFVNVQGEEPLLDPVAVDTAVRSLLEEPAAQIATVPPD